MIRAFLHFRELEKIWWRRGHSRSLNLTKLAIRFRTYHMLSTFYQPLCHLSRANRRHGDREKSWKYKEHQNGRPTRSPIGREAHNFVQEHAATREICVISGSFPRLRLPRLITSSGNFSSGNINLSSRAASKSSTTNLSPDTCSCSGSTSSAGS